eukprot:4212500-Amphidinium_carterae.1
MTTVVSSATSLRKFAKPNGQEQPVTSAQTGTVAYKFQQKLGFVMAFVAIARLAHDDLDCLCNGLC